MKQKILPLFPCKVPMSHLKELIFYKKKVKTSGQGSGLGFSASSFSPHNSAIRYVSSLDMRLRNKSLKVPQLVIGRPTSGMRGDGKLRTHRLAFLLSGLLIH